jgi:hypothetical protein
MQVTKDMLEIDINRLDQECVIILNSILKYQPLELFFYVSQGS